MRSKLVGAARNLGEQVEDVADTASPTKAGKHQAVMSL